MNTITKGKIQKKKKAPVEFGADNIENTAPVKKILLDLLDKNRKALTYYCQTLRPRRSTKENLTFHFTLTGHPLYAFPDDWDGDLNFGYFEPFAYKSLMPKIITPPHNIERNDPVTEPMKLKNDWITECKNLRQVAVTFSMLENYETFNEDVVQCPKHVVDLAAHLDSDPDPYFEDSYNWYYAGNGNMHLICVDWVDYLLHSEFSKLFLTQFSKQENSLQTCVATFDCEGENIFETICSTNNIVALRTKYKVLILKIVSSQDKIEFEKIKAVEAELPFTSISFDGYHKNILYITTLNGKVTIVNLDRLTGRTVNLKTKVKSLVNHWNAVISAERLVYTHVSKNHINIYDKRTNKINHSWCAVRDVSDHLDCNDITVAKQFEGSHALYYGTDHHLLLMDLRYQRKYKPKPLLRWTHGMQCVPTYMSICHFEFNKEIVCLSSQWCEDTCVISNYNISLMKDSEMPGITIPYRPPNLLETLNGAREKLLCFDLYSSIDTRLSTVITGNLIMDSGENYTILTHNALGDISCHTLFPEHMESFLENDSIQHLHEWSQLYKTKPKEFQVSSIVDITKVWTNLKRVPPSYEFVDSKTISKKELELREKEIQDTFENEELDSGILDLWTNATNETITEQSSLAINMYYSDESHHSE